MSAPTVVFVQEGESIDYTPGSAVSAGDVLVQNTMIGVAKLDIPASRLGALTVEGVFLFPKATTGGSAIDVGKRVYWDGVNKVVQEDSVGGTLPYAGVTTAASADADATQRVALNQHPSFAAVLNSVGGVGAAYKIARGQHVMASASETVVTGLATVVAVVASLDDDPVVGCAYASASIGDQAGSPAAGSVLLKAWMPTDSTHTTPIAATTLSKKVNWIAVGT